MRPLEEALPKGTIRIGEYGVGKDVKGEDQKRNSKKIFRKGGRQ